MEQFMPVWAVISLDRLIYIKEQAGMQEEQAIVQLFSMALLTIPAFRFLPSCLGISQNEPFSQLVTFVYFCNHSSRNKTLKRIKFAFDFFNVSLKSHQCIYTSLLPIKNIDFVY